MTDTDAMAAPELPGGPHDLEFFFDPGCPFAWQTSVWARRVAELRGLSIGWRFISLLVINADNDLPAGQVRAQERTHRILRVCAAARTEHGNDAVGDLYRAFGERFWYAPPDGELRDRLRSAAEATTPELVVAAAGLPASLADAADDEGWDSLVRAESEEAFRRTGPDVGTPIITFGPPAGGSLFGPVLSSVPDDHTALAAYDALRVLVDLPSFSELKRSARAPLDLPLLSGS